MASLLTNSLIQGAFGPGSGSGAAAGILNANQKSAFHPCVLTWYDPALGGINTTGGANPHAKTASGQPYDPHAFTCAAPSNYAFGTLIEFKYGGKTVTCKVNDRGGAITGRHFDLARAPATALGIIGRGVAPAQFRTVGSGQVGVSGIAAGSLGGAPAGAGTSGIASAIQFLGALFNPTLWLRIGEVVLGGIVLVIAAYVLTRTAMGDTAKQAFSRLKPKVVPIPV